MKGFLPHLNDASEFEEEIRFRFKRCLLLGDEFL